jgi:hypothetical protein
MKKRAFVERVWIYSICSMCVAADTDGGDGDTRMKEEADRRCSQQMSRRYMLSKNVWTFPDGAKYRTRRCRQTIVVAGIVGYGESVDFHQKE